MKFQSATIFILAALVTSPAQADDFSGEYGGWQIGRADDACGMTMGFEGPGETTLTLVRYQDGSVATSITNLNWSAKKGEKYKVAYMLNGSAYSGDGLGTSDYARAGFLSKFGSDFAADFTKGATLYVFLDDKLIDQLSLAGTGVAMSAVDRCLGAVRRELAAERKEAERWARLPEDPFKDAAPQAPTAPRGAIPKDGASWISTDDYPSAALREGRQGTSRFTVKVGEDGRVVECQIVGSSGSPDLDEAACAAMKRRARFEPALDAEGKPTTGTYASVMQWRIPQ